MILYEKLLRMIILHTDVLIEAYSPGFCTKKANIGLEQ